MLWAGEHLPKILMQALIVRNNIQFPLMWNKGICSLALWNPQYCFAFYVYYEPVA